MNVRKPVDYGVMYGKLTAILSRNLPQMKEICAIGRAVSQRPEKGAAVAAAEFLRANFPDRAGFSPRNVRRMRDFYRTYENDEALLRLAMKIGWTLNVVIMEAELTRDERKWYLEQAREQQWSKTVLLEKLASAAHMEKSLDESKQDCYTKENGKFDEKDCTRSIKCLLRRNIMKKVLPYSLNEIKGATSIGTWGPNNIPIYSVHTMHEFNQLVGYLKYLNASNGTVLYRGQPKDYGGLKPSGNRENGCVEDNVIRALAKDKDFRHYIGLDNPDIRGWGKYQEIIISAVLQHYGANTNCMDFVDNHWCALWFGLHRFNSDTCRYSKSDEKDLYIYLYLADTNCSSIHGTYIGEDSYTVDLRKALPSYFLRPASQHGWVVCGNEPEKCRDYAENVLCVIRIDVDNAFEWLGQGKLLSMENFFPDYDIDDGYRVLLTRQQRSGVYKSSNNQILLPDTIRNYHYR